MEVPEMKSRPDSGGDAEHMIAEVARWIVEVGMTGPVSPDGVDGTIPTEDAFLVDVPIGGAR